MASYRTTVDSPRSIEDVFAYLSDFTNTAEWDPGIVESELLGDGPIGLGSRYRVVSSTAGRELTLIYEVTEWDPPNRFVLVGESDNLRSVDVLTFEPLDDGSTRATYHADLALRGPSRVADPLLHLMFQVIGRRAAEGLRDVLDAA
ncbi:MAG: SRPBCC family protein [Acidimicrobiales bacterium]